jgi:hypothetical protein
MTEAEWFASDNVLQMLGELRQFYLDDEVGLRRLLHEYYLACCAAIWKLLPQEESRRAIEVAEQYVAGRATRDELGKAAYDAEGAAWSFEYEGDRQAIARWIEQTQAIPESELRAMIHPLEAVSGISTHELLRRAAYFAEFAVSRPDPWADPLDEYVPFLSAEILRQVAGNPFLSEGQSSRSAWSEKRASKPWLGN